MAAFETRQAQRDQAYWDAAAKAAQDRRQHELDLKIDAARLTVFLISTFAQLAGEKNFARDFAVGNGAMVTIAESMNKYSPFGWCNNQSHAVSARPHQYGYLGVVSSLLRRTAILTGADHMLLVMIGE